MMNKVGSERAAFEAGVKVGVALGQMLPALRALAGDLSKGGMTMATKKKGKKKTVKKLKKK